MPKWRNGRRGGLKNRCPQGRDSSTLSFGTSQSLHSSLNINPSDQLAYQYRGDSYKALGKIAAAKEDYKAAQKLR